MPLRECMASHTQREYMVWMAWLDEQWNRPDRTDYYQMQTAAEIRRGRAKNPGSVKLQHLRIPFKRVSEEGEPGMTLEEATATSKARWAARRGRTK